MTLRRRWASWWVGACVMTASASPAFAATTAIRAGAIIVRSGVLVNAVIVIDNDRITSIGTGAPPAGSEVIDLGRLTVIPGGAIIRTPSPAPDNTAGAIKALVERFLLHLGDHDVDQVAADLAPKAIVVVTRARDGQWTNSFQTGDEWIAAMRRNATPVTFREPLTNVTVTIDSDHLAFVRADFQVVRDGRVQSYGVDEFTLVRDAAAWKIAVVAYTSLPAPSPPPANPASPQ